MEGFRVQKEIEVRFRDMDAMGHVNNAVYLSYFEQARIEYWKKLAGVAKFKQTMFILGEAAITYKAPAVMGEVLVIGIRVSEIRTSSFSYEYLVVEKNSGRVVADGKTAQVAYDYGKQKTLIIPDDLRRAIESFEEKDFS